jgi:hypothetical protein
MVLLLHSLLHTSISPGKNEVNDGKLNDVGDVILA